MERNAALKKFILCPHVLYFIAVMVTGTLFAFLNPFYQETDADMHFFRSCDVSYGNVIAPFAVISHDPSYEEVPANINDYPTWVVTTDRNEGGGIQHRMKKVSTTWDTEPYHDPRSYASLYYYPQALGLVISRILGLTAYGSVIWGHMMNLIAYAVITAFAVKSMPVYKSTFAASAMLPMCVYLAASFSADAMLNAFCFLFIALVFNYAYDDIDGVLGIRQMLPLGILLWLIYLNKYVYVVLGILVFLIPKERFGSRKNYWKTFAIALAPMVIYLIWQIASGAFVPQYNLLDVMGITKEQAGTAEVLYPGITTQKEFVMAYPAEFVKVLLRSMYLGISDWMVLSSTLGWLNAGLEPITWWMPAVMVIIAAYDSKELCCKNSAPAGSAENGTAPCREITFRPWERILIGLCVPVLIVAVISSIYIFDEASNTVGWPRVRGIQGRYFMVCVPLILMSLMPVKIKSFVKKPFYLTVGIMTGILLFAVVIFYKHYYGYGILNF